MKYSKFFTAQYFSFFYSLMTSSSPLLSNSIYTHAESQTKISYLSSTPADPTASLTYHKHLKHLKPSELKTELMDFTSKHPAYDILLWAQLLILVTGELFLMSPSPSLHMSPSSATLIFSQCTSRSQVQCQPCPTPPRYTSLLYTLKAPYIFSCNFQHTSYSLFNLCLAH